MFEDRALLLFQDFARNRQVCGRSAGSNHGSRNTYAGVSARAVSGF